MVVVVVVGIVVVVVELEPGCRKLVDTVDLPGRRRDVHGSQRGIDHLLDQLHHEHNSVVFVGWRCIGVESCIVGLGHCI